jgi:hypothetical protein
MADWLAKYSRGVSEYFFGPRTTRKGSLRVKASWASTRARIAGLGSMVVKGQNTLGLGS